MAKCELVVAVDDPDRGCCDGDEVVVRKRVWG